MSIFKIHAVLLSSSLLFAVAMPAYEVSPGLISVDVSYVEANDGLYLKFELQLHGEKSYDVYCSDLPFESVTAGKLGAYLKNRPSVHLKQLGRISDTGPLEFRLTPGYIYNDRINLSEVFIDFRKAHEKHDIVVDWSYALTSVNGHHFNDLAGSILIPKLRSSYTRPTVERGRGLDSSVQRVLGPPRGPTVRASEGGGATALQCSGPAAAQT